MRRIATWGVMAVAGVLGGFQPANGGLLGTPIGLQSAIQHIKFETPALPPMAYTQFCLRYQDECRAKPMFRGGPVRLTAQRCADLREINQTINQEIIPESHGLELASK